MIIVDSSEANSEDVAVDNMADNDPTDTGLIPDSQTSDADVRQTQDCEEFHPVEQELSSTEVVTRETVSAEEEKFVDADFVSQSEESLVNEQLHQNTEIQKQDGGECSEGSTNQQDPAEALSDTSHVDSAASQSQVRSTMPDLHNQEAISDNVTNEIIETVTTSVRNSATALPVKDDTVNAETSHQIPSVTNGESQETVTENEPSDSPAASNHKQNEQPAEHNVQVCFEREVKVVETQPKIETIQGENNTTADSSN